MVCKHRFGLRFKLRTLEHEADVYDVMVRLRSEWVRPEKKSDGTAYS
jgi:hypothetical protein